jgi:hypothetical protein
VVIVILLRKSESTKTEYSIHRNDITFLYGRSAHCRQRLWPFDGAAAPSLSCRKQTRQVEII